MRRNLTRKERQYRMMRLLASVLLLALWAAVLAVSVQAGMGV